MQRISCIVPVVALGLVGTAAAQSRHDLSIVYCNTPGHPTNVVPGLGVPFNPGGGTASAFERPKFSLDGTHFAINAVADTLTSDDDVLIFDGAVILREGSPTPWGGGASNVGLIDGDFGDVNLLGDLIYAGDTTAATTEDETVALFSGGTWTVLAQEGSTTNVGTFAAGIIGLHPPVAWGSTMDAARITTTGQYVWRASAMQNLTTGTSNDQVVVRTGGTALQEGDRLHLPAGQVGPGVYAWETFDAGDVYITPDGAHILVEGALAGPTTTDEVVVLDGVVVVQEGVPLLGGPFVEPVDSAGIVKAWLDTGGNWYARGNNDVTETDWIYRSGTVVAQSDGTDEVVAGSGEHWDDAASANCFFAMDGNSLGHYVIGGFTDGAATANSVLVFDDGIGNRFVAVREGDAIDLDGNGLFDDDRFFNTFGDDDALLLEDDSIVFVATMRTAAGTSVDQGVFRLTPRTASCTLRNGSGVNPVACTCVTLPIVGSTWTLDVSSGPQTIATFLFADPAPIPPFPIFGGELLVAPTAFAIPTSLNLPYGYTGLQFSVQGMRLDFDGVDITFVLTNAQDAVLGQ